MKTPQTSNRAATARAPAGKNMPGRKSRAILILWFKKIWGITEWDFFVSRQRNSSEQKYDGAWTHWTLCYETEGGRHQAQRVTLPPERFDTMAKLLNIVRLVQLEIGHSWSASILICRTKSKGIVIPLIFPRLEIITRRRAYAGLFFELNMALRVCLFAAIKSILNDNL